jgi:hypothetical protein
MAITASIIARSETGCTIKMIGTAASDTLTITPGKTTLTVASTGNVTFVAKSGSTQATITRASGSWITDLGAPYTTFGALLPVILVVTGTTSNNGTYYCFVTSATVLTVASNQTVAAEVAASAVFTGSYSCPLLQLGQQITTASPEVVISKASWAIRNTGYASVVRNSIPVLDLQGQWDNSLGGHFMAPEQPTQPIVTTFNTTGGMVILEIRKTAGFGQL